jgi:hypothetical protein
MRSVGHVAHMGEMRNAYKIVAKRPEGKRSHGRKRHRRENNIKMNLTKIGYGLDSTDSGY